MCEFVGGVCLFVFLLVGLIGLQVMAADVWRKVAAGAEPKSVCRLCGRYFEDVARDGALQISDDGCYCSPGCERAASVALGGTVADAAATCARLLCGDGAENEQAREEWKKWIIGFSPRLSIDDCEIEKVVRIQKCLAAAFRAHDAGLAVNDAFAAEFRLIVKDIHKAEQARLARMRENYEKCKRSFPIEKAVKYGTLLDALDARAAWVNRLAANPLYTEGA